MCLITPVRTCGQAFSLSGDTLMAASKLLRKNVFLPALDCAILSEHMARSASG